MDRCAEPALPQHVCTPAAALSSCHASKAAAPAARPPHQMAPGARTCPSGHTLHIDAKVLGRRRLRQLRPSWVEHHACRHKHACHPLRSRGEPTAVSGERRPAAGGWQRRAGLGSHVHRNCTLLNVLLEALCAWQPAQAHLRRRQQAAAGTPGAPPSAPAADLLAGGAMGAQVVRFARRRPCSQRRRAWLAAAVLAGRSAGLLGVLTQNNVGLLVRYMACQRSYIGTR